MKLTIGMIVKNEEKYLERCLTALKPILDNVDSELIITDTGSTDRTVEIAERFTDKVLHFEWINDFAAARNTGLEAAKGEWFMFVDADEIFQSCDDIIDFFNSGEYRKYNSASFIIRSYLSESGFYSDFDAARLTHITSETRFVGKIHEALTAYRDPCKNLNVIADHYGYLFESEEDSKKKFERNSKLLLEIYEKEKNKNPNIYSQLYDCFYPYDIEKANEYWDKGVEFCNKNNSIVLVGLYVTRAFVDYFLKDYSSSLEICKRYFRIEKTIRPGEITSDAEILAIKALDLTNLERYEESIDVYLKFFDIYKKIKSGKLITRDTKFNAYNIATDNGYLFIVNAFARSCILCGKYNLCLTYLQSLPIKQFCFDENHINNLVDTEIELLWLMNYQNAGKLYNNLNVYGKEMFKLQLVCKLFETDNRNELISAINVLKNTDENNDSILLASEIIDNAIELHKNRNYKECISEMKRAVTIYESIAPIVSEYCNKVIAEYEREVKEEPQNEMQKLAIAIKGNIRAYIEAKNFEAAKKTLDEYKKIMPGDPETEKLSAMIG